LSDQINAQLIHPVQRNPTATPYNRGCWVEVQHFGILSSSTERRISGLAENKVEILTLGGYDIVPFGLSE